MVSWHSHATSHSVLYDKAESNILKRKIKYLISTQIFYQQKVNIISPYLGAGAVIDDTSQTHFGSQSGLVINLSKEGKQKTFCSILKLKMIKTLCFYFYCVWAAKLRYVINCSYLSVSPCLFTLQLCSHESLPSLVQRLEQEPRFEDLVKIWE